MTSREHDFVDKKIESLRADDPKLRYQQDNDEHRLCGRCNISAKLGNELPPCCSNGHAYADNDEAGLLNSPSLLKWQREHPLNRICTKCNKIIETGKTQEACKYNAQPVTPTIASSSVNDNVLALREKRVKEHFNRSTPTGVSH